MKKTASTGVDTCAFLPCEQADTCCLQGGCVQTRFRQQLKAAAENANQELPQSRAKALNGTKPGRGKSKR